MSLTKDRNNPCLHSIKEDGQQACYLVLSEEERAKGFVRPVYHTYRHSLCGTETTMGNALAETYARNPSFYTETFCCHCGSHFPLVAEDGQRQFEWIHEHKLTGKYVGN